MFAIFREESISSCAETARSFFGRHGNRGWIHLRTVETGSMGTGGQMLLFLELRYHTFLNTSELERSACARHACGHMDWAVCSDAGVIAADIACQAV
jgi:hypothetical protein